MIDRTHPLSVVRQCQLLGVARSTAYYQPTPVADAELALMRRIDELHLQYPFAGARMLRDLLRQDGQAIGRRRVASLMRHMGITEQTYYRWKKEYGGLRVDQAKRLKGLEQENARLKRLVADLSLDNSILKEVAAGNF